MQLPYNDLDISLIVLLISISSAFEKGLLFLRCSFKNGKTSFKDVLKQLLVRQFPDSPTTTDRQLKSSCMAESILKILYCPESFFEKLYTESTFSVTFEGELSNRRYGTGICRFLN